MRHSSITASFAFSVVAIAVLCTGNDSCLATTSGGAWGSWGGSSGYAGGSWGSRGFRTPVRNFFANRQPVRNVLREVGNAFSYRGGSRGWGGSGGFGSGGGYGSTGYQYYSSGNNYGSTGAGYSYGGGQISYGSTGSAGSTGFTYGSLNSFPSATYGTPINTTGCQDCVGSSSINYNNAISPSSVPYGDSYLGSSSIVNDGGIISGDQSVIPAEQYYDSGAGSGSIPSNSSEGSGVRGFDSPPSPEPADSDETTSFQRTGDAILNVSVPKDTIVFVNNKETKTEGAIRSYVSKRLKHGKDYSFNLEAVSIRNGKEISLKKTVVMRAGISTSVDFDFDSPVLTKLTVKVPENATVKLCGNNTSVAGEVRNFKTKLKPGQVWEDYDIDISYEKDGKTVNQRRVITIEAGQKYVVDFDSDRDFYVSK